jgi:hypothetical protein
MSNNRIFYACQAVAIQPQFASGTSLLDSSGVIPVHGVQSVGINTTFNLEQVFELGQIQIYENIEGVPEVEVTLEKVLDGYPLIYHLASSGVDTVFQDTKARSTLIGRSKERCNVYLGIFSDAQEAVGLGNGAITEVKCSGMFLSSLSYTLPVDGNCTESVTLVGNNKVWNVSGTKLFTDNVADSLSADGNDVPRNLTEGSAYGGIQRRENVDIKNSILPTSIEGVLGTAVGNAWDSTNNTPKVHVQNCTISTDLSREDILELGRKTPYARPANFPVEVTCEFEVIAISGDLINAYEGGDPSFDNTINVGNNTPEERIMVRLHDGTVFNLGGKNRLSSVNYTGGDAGGGNATISYSFVTYNEFSVTHPTDPAGAADKDDYEPIYNATATTVAPTTTEAPTTTTEAPE